MVNKYLISAALLAIATMAGGRAIAASYKYKLQGNKIVLFGKAMTASIPLVSNAPDSENNTMVHFTSSPNKTYVIVQVITGDNSEFFLFSKREDDVVPLRFGQKVNTIVSWENNRMFTASWGDMAGSTTLLVDAETPNHPRAFENLIKFIKNGRYFISSTDNGIKIGCVDDCGFKPEIFVLKDASGQPITDWAFIDKISEEGRDIKVVVRDRAGKRVVRTISPEVLSR